jgi:hypothetical protein
MAATAQAFWRNLECFRSVLEVAIMDVVEGDSVDLKVLLDGREVVENNLMKFVPPCSGGADVDDFLQWGDFMDRFVMPS